jgi:hypothetical protein
MNLKMELTEEMEKILVIYSEVLRTVYLVEGQLVVDM